MKKVFLLMILLSLLFLTSGCWDYRELNTMAIVGSIGIDYNEKDELFKVSAQVFNAKKTSNSSAGTSDDKSPITFYENEAKTVHEALRGMLIEAPKKLYIGHLEMIVFGEKLAQEHFLEALDFLLRDAESRKDFLLFVTKDCDASDILKALTPLEGTPSTSISNTLVSNSTYYGKTVMITYDEALSAVYGTGREVVLPVLKIEGNLKKSEEPESVSGTTQKAEIFVEGAGIFKNNRLIGFLTPEETRGYNFIVGDMEKSVISFPCDDEGNYAAMEFIRIKSGSKTEIKDKQVKAAIEITGEAVISEVNCKIKLTDSQNIKELEKKMNKKIASTVQKTLDTVMQKYNSDIFGFGNKTYRIDYDFWKKSKDKWDELFPQIETKINSKVNIKNKGSVTSSAKEG